MSILASLVRAYDHLKGAPALGYSMRPIHYCLVIDENGALVGEPVSWGTDRRGLPEARKMIVPYFGGRSGKRAPPYFLWDNTAYTLGVSQKEGFDAAQRFEDFKKYHLSVLENSTDKGIVAFLSFLSSWDIHEFAEKGFPEAMKDRNLVFRLHGDDKFIHEREAATEAWLAAYKPDAIHEGVCLLTGDRAQIARIHPPIETFDNPARIVSFDKDSDAFASYGHIQAENAPTGVEAAFKYTTVLNRFLDRDSGHRIQIGDASTVFWADSSEAKAQESEDLFVLMMGDTPTKPDEETQSKRIGELLERLRGGEQLEELRPDLAEGVRFHVLGLAPNAARISIRFNYDDDFCELAKNYQRFVADMRIEPRAKERRITIYNLVLRTAPARRDRNDRIKFDGEQVSPLLTGELFRAILTGDRFPRALLAQIIMRVRSDHLLDSLRISMIKAVIVRDMRKDGRLPKEDYLVRSDPDDPNPARRLGRLFALIERAQLAALGDKVNTTVKDKYLGSCAATPAQVISKLILAAEEHHLKRLRNGHSDADWIKDAEHARRVGASINRDLGRLAAWFNNSFPKQHSDEEQGLFLIGYYQERYGSRKSDDGGDPADDQTSEGEE